MTPTAIQIQKVYHSFEGRAVLSDISVAVPCGCFFTIIGPNGSGKTTLLKLIMGLLACRQGTIEILGRPIERYAIKRLACNVAYVPQTVSVTFAFTVMQVVLMGRAPHLGMLGVEKDQDLELARQATALAGVDHLAQRRLDQLSGGEQQRVFIARAICQQPKILLLDEPTAALDLAHQVRVMDLMEQLKTEQGVTVVMVSHDLNLAAMYADQMVLLSKGRTVGMGSPQQVLAYEQLEQVYGCPLLVDQSPLGDYPRVHLVPGRYLKG